MSFAETSEHRANLGLIAAYLEQLPDDYERFDMTYFSRICGPEPRGFVNRPIELVNHHCGIVGDAVGHGPVAGIQPLASETWDTYTGRIFGDWGGIDWRWCFGSDWAGIDNTPRGAAARIRYFLDKGVTVLWRYPSPEDLPLYAPYRIDAPAQQVSV